MFFKEIERKEKIQLQRKGKHKVEVTCFLNQKEIENKKERRTICNYKCSGNLFGL